MAILKQFSTFEHSGCAGSWAPSPGSTVRAVSLHALIAEVVAAQDDACEGVVHPQGIGEGLCRVGTKQWPSFTTKIAHFTPALLNYLHCQLAVPRVWHKHAQETRQDCRSCTPIRSSRHHPTGSIQHPNTPQLRSVSPTKW